MLLSTVQSTLTPILFIGIIAHNNRQLAIYSIILSLWWLNSLGSIGFSSAITVRVGYFLGANDPKRSKRSAVIRVILAQTCLSSCSIVLLFVSEPLSHLFTTEPSFAKELQWNIRIFSLLINSGVKTVIQGVMNACCKQGLQFIIRFVFQVVIGSVASMLIVQYVQWKALSVSFIYAITNVICSVISTSILVCSNWENTALVVSENTLHNARIKEEIEDGGFDLSLIKSKFGYMMLVSIRYLFCISTSMFVFAIIVFIRLY